MRATWSELDRVVVPLEYIFFRRALGCKFGSWIYCVWLDRPGKTQCIYVGQTRTVRRRLIEHLSKPTALGEALCDRDLMADGSLEVISIEGPAYLAEAYYLALCRPRLNQQRPLYHSQEPRRRASVRHPPITRDDVDLIRMRPDPLRDTWIRRFTAIRGVPLIGFGSDADPVPAVHQTELEFDAGGENKDDDFGLDDAA